MTCYPTPQASEATSQHLYLNQVLPLVLGKLGKLVFHASAVEVAGGAVAFVAESGRGKSTLAASFATGGWRFLTDDGLVLEEHATGYQVMPSHPSIRLWDDSQDALIANGAATDPPLDFTPKSRFLACKLGARLVHACDANPAIQVARELARANGFADRITCHEGRSDKLTLPDRVDVIVSDLRGALPLHGRHLPALIDARMRHLKPGGIMLPHKDQLWVALAESAEEHQRAVAPWGKNDFGFDLGRWSSLLANSWIAAQPRASQLASAPVPWAEIDYRTIESPDVKSRVTCVASREAAVHGFFLWFNATIADGVTFSGGPDAPKMPYGCAFFPWPRPVTVRPGDAVEIDIDATLVGDDCTWTWRTRHGDTRFAQSTFFGACLSPETLRKRAAGHVPELNEDGRVTLRVLEGLGQRRPLGQVAEALFDEFPGRFASQAECLGFVGKLSAKYSV